MINQQKVELVTGAAMYERTSRRVYRFDRYFSKKNKRVIAFRSIPAGAAIALLILCLVIISQYDWAVSVYYGIGPVMTAAAIAGAAAVITFIYVVCSLYILGRKFENHRGSFVKYRLSLEEIKRMDDVE